MKRVLFLTLSIMILLLLVSCDMGNLHTHAYGEWETIKEASCTEDGQRARSCSCGESEKEVISAKGHTEETVEGTPATCTESGLTEGKKCSVCGEIFAKQEEIPALNHDYKYTEETDSNGNIITVATCQRNSCKTILKSASGLYDAEGRLIASWAKLVDLGFNIEKDGWRLRYVLEKNNSLQGGIKLVIDDSVSAIGSLAFEGCTSITSIEIPIGVISIGSGAFLRTSITDIFIPSTITKIGNGAFGECFSLKNIAVDQNNKHFKDIDGNLYDKEGKTLIQYAIAKEDAKFTVPNDVTHIHTYAFSCSSALSSINIPSSVISIGACAFDDCALLKNIYFDGTTEEWEDIDFPVSNSARNIVIHYDGKMQFHVFGFAGSFGSSGSAGFIQKIVVDGEKIHIDGVLYDIKSCVDTFNIEYSEYVYSYIENRKETEKLDVLEKIKECEKWYILEETEEEDSKLQRAMCYVDGVHYLLTITGENEETGTTIIHRINWAAIG